MNPHIPDLQSIPPDKRYLLPEYVRRFEEAGKREYFENISLRDYSKEFWEVREPTTNFQNSWVVGALCEHLTACYERQIRRLLINIYFRSAKSTFASVFFPSWVWTKKPSERFLTISFAEALAQRDAYHCKQVIISEKYQKHYGELYKISSDQSAKSNYENNKTGARRSIGIGGQTTGFGGGIKIFDDPNDTQKSESKVIRDTTNEWFTGTFTTRSDDFATDVSIVIQQRTNPKDVTGHIKELGLPYEELTIPLEYSGKTYVTSIGFSDPRTVIGEVADPNRFPPQAVKELRKTLGIKYYGQAQQEPRNPEGDVIKKSWYKDRFTLPIHYEEDKWLWDKKDIIRTHGYTDLAGSDSLDSDRTANVIMLRLADGITVKLWQYSGHWTPNPRNTNILNFYSAWNQVFPDFPIHVESNSILGEQGMTDLRNMLLRNGLNVKKDYAKVSKTERAINQKDSYITNAEPDVGETYGRIEFYQGNLFNEIMTGYGTPQSWKDEFFTESCALSYGDNGEIEYDHIDLLDDDVGCFNKINKKPKKFGVVK